MSTKETGTKVYYVQMMFPVTDDAATSVELRYDLGLTHEEALAFERAMIEGWHTGQMHVQAARMKSGRAVAAFGVATDEAMRQGLGGEGPAAADYTETSHELAAEEAERLRASLEEARRELGATKVDVKEARDETLAAMRERDEAVARELEARRELATLRINVERLINRHAKT